MNNIIKIAVFASGSGTNFQQIHKKILSGEIAGKIEVLVSNKPGCGAVNYAKGQGIKCTLLRSQDPKDNEDVLLRLFSDINPDLIILAGYMKLVPASITRLYRHKILNIHPALLPSFGGKGMYGIKVHQAVISANKKVSGATVHFVDEKYDHGPIIDFMKVNVHPNDTAESLAARVLRVEHILYPRVVKAYCENRIIWEEDEPRVIP